MLRATAEATAALEFLVVGSAAILATHDDAALPDAATRSDEADIAPFRDPDGTKGAQIEIALGRGSRFFDTFQYSADAVDLTTAAAPDRWEGRLVRFERPGTNGAVGPGRLEAHDLAAAKLAAGRDKDFEFVEALLRERLIDRAVLVERVGLLPRDRVLPAFLARAQRWMAEYGKPPRPVPEYRYASVTFGRPGAPGVGRIHVRRHPEAATLCGRTGGTATTAVLNDPVREIGSELCGMCRRALDRLSRAEARLRFAADRKPRTVTVKGRHLDHGGAAASLGQRPPERVAGATCVLQLRKSLGLSGPRGRASSLWPFWCAHPSAHRLARPVPLDPGSARRS